ncbi:hypothetical protein ACSFA2_03705 [Variovorax sp. LT2P21]|uniref:hypothetical protein n=1 Tax=Variovorax sp. LT2P21 TaxID=3443731 RepID=UPI003F477641
MATATAERPRTAAAGMLSRRILVTIDQGMTIKTPKVIYEHELPIFQEIHGGGAEDGEGGAVTVIEDPVGFLDKEWKPRQDMNLLQHNKKQDDLTRPSEGAGIGFVFLGNPAEEWSRLAAAYGKCVDEDKLVVERIYGRAREGRLATMLGKPSLKDLPIAQLRQLIVGTGYVVDVAKDTPEAERPAILERRKAFLALDVAGLAELAKTEGIEI